MRTLASFDGYEIKQDINGSITLNGRQFDSAMDAARSVRDNPELCAALIKQVLSVNDSHVDGLTAFDESRKIKHIDVNGLQELTGEPQVIGGDSDA
jgi:hypothetical protein